jgi:hypothetical protein
MKQRKIKRVYQGRNVITVSAAVGEDLVEQFAIRPAQLKTIYNPFDIPALRAAAEAPGEQPAGTIFHVGRFHPGKRHDRLIEAYAQSGIDAPLVLLGQGKPEQNSACASWRSSYRLAIGFCLKASRKTRCRGLNTRGCWCSAPTAKALVTWWLRLFCWILRSPAPAVLAGDGNPHRRISPRPGGSEQPGAGPDDAKHLP